MELDIIISPKGNFSVPKCFWIHVYSRSRLDFPFQVGTVSLVAGQMYVTASELTSRSWRSRSVLGQSIDTVNISPKRQYLYITWPVECCGPLASHLPAVFPRKFPRGQMKDSFDLCTLVHIWLLLVPILFTNLYFNYFMFWMSKNIYFTIIKTFSNKIIFTP